MKLISRNSADTRINDWDQLFASIPYSEKEQVYRPVFSYTSGIINTIGHMFEEMTSLRDIVKSISQSSISPPLFEDQNSNSKSAKRPEVNMSHLRYIKNQIHNELGLNYQGESWTAEDLFKEHEHNVVFSQCGAAHLLVSEISTAISSQINELNRCLKELSERSLSSRRRKQISRTFSMAQVTLDLYSLTGWIALLYILRRLRVAGDDQSTFPNIPESTLSQAVKRSRMVVSTYSTSSNADRALKALSQYMAGKHVKAIIQSGTINFTEVQSILPKSK